MDNDKLVQMEINSDVDILLARQVARELAKEVGFGIIDETRIVTAVSEITRNALQYAGGGSLTVRVLSQEDRKGLEIICEDRGPGIADKEKALQGGWSTGGGLGRGLSGTRALVDEFELQSDVGVGTKVVVRKWKLK